ncbi:AraC family transcriptional regulator ligand-binding domain-containing protein [Roseibium sp.]|uniref:AraC family transcriptional regulator n=1 Tax=Roseibium sp. TaxID=1936156 RepID=UPI003BAC1D09
MSQNMTRDRVKCTDEFWNAAEAIGLKRSAILSEARLPIALGANGAVMSIDQAFELWRAIEVLGGRDAAHDLAVQTNTGALPPNFIVLFHAKDFGDAIYRMARYKALSAPEVFELTDAGGEFSISLSFPTAKTPIPEGHIDATFVFFVNMARICTGTKVTPKRIEFTRGRSQKLQDWYDCPIKWNTRKARLVFRRSDLDLPFIQYNRELLEMLDTALENRLAENSKGQSSYSQQVRWHLHRRLTGGKPNLANIAEDMAVSERSLQRRLREEGYSFQTILSETRRELAKEYLSQPNLEFSEIAFLLAYEDQGSFFRAFQKWENQTPTEWREANRAS